MKRTLAVGLSALVALALTSACAGETASEESVGRVGSADTSPSFYFRSNATGWGVDENTRLLPFAASVLGLAYTVTQPWMVSDADTAIITETNQLDGWGTSQTFLGASAKSLVVPATSSVSDALVTQTNGGDVHFKVKYPAEEQFVVLVDTAKNTITIQPAAVLCAGVCPGGFTCSVGMEGRPTCTPACEPLPCP
jgi:hypothetical protein